MHRYGTIVDASVARERDGASKGFGYVTLDASSSPDALLNDIHPLGGKEIRVLLTKEALIGTDNKKVYIGNSDHLSQDEIRDAFMGFGQVRRPKSACAAIAVGLAPPCELEVRASRFMR